MDNTLYLLAASMDISSQTQQRLAKNLSNASTPGFKEILSRVESQNSSPVEEDEISTQIPCVENFLSFHQGNLLVNDDDMSVALSGPGFIEVGENTSVTYMRSGRFYVDKDRDLVTSQGYKVQGVDGRISIPEGREENLVISDTGAIFVNDREIASLKIVNFSDPKKLISQGGTYWNASKMQANIDNESKIYQGYSEKATVNELSSMKDIIANMRHFEAIQKITQTVDESWQNLLQNVR